MMDLFDRTRMTRPPMMMMVMMMMVIMMMMIIMMMMMMKWMKEMWWRAAPTPRCDFLLKMMDFGTKHEGIYNKH